MALCGIVIDVGVAELWLIVLCWFFGAACPTLEKLCELIDYLLGLQEPADTYDGGSREGVFLPMVSCFIRGEIPEVF